MNKYILLIVISCLSLSGMGQNVWEKPEAETKNVEKEQPKKEKHKQDSTKAVSKEDPKYLAGAVTEENGKVKWTLDINVPGKSAQEIYDITLKYLTELTKQENQLEGSNVSLVNKKDHIIVARIREWLVFKNQFISLDRAKLNYTLIATCNNERLVLTMDRITYNYEEERGRAKSAYTAEEMISDSYALNKNGTKIYRGCAKFRKKTIDRKDELFGNITEVIRK